MNSVKSILKSRRLAPKKKLGQNFLVNPNTAERILDLAAFSSSDIVVELGVGLGALTVPLAARVQHVFGLEIDRGIIQLHQEKKILPANVTLLDQDLLKADFRDLADQAGGRLKIIANLPYSVSNPLLFRLMEFSDVMDSAILMLQKEVGLRLTAKTRTKEYGVLSVLLGSCAAVKIIMRLGPGQFHPRPKVDSVVAKITFNPPPAQVEKLPPYDPAILTQVVKAAFGQRRKKLLNALTAASLFGMDKTKVATVLKKAVVPETNRAEQLTLEEYVRLTNMFVEVASSA